MDFWRRSARISRKDKIKNTTIKQKMNVTRYLVDDIKTKQLQWCGVFQEWKREDYRRSYEMASTRKNENEVDLNVPGRTGLED